MDPSGTGDAHAPEAGTSLIRTGTEADELQRRLERPARMGRYLLLLLGAIVLGAGLAVFLTNGSLLGIAFALFGAVLLVLGVVQHLLLRRELAHWPKEALLHEDGIELVLRNGEVRVLGWSDPEFAMALVARRAKPPVNREWLLLWIADTKVPSVELSEEGFDAVMREAEAHRLVVNERRRGKGDAESRWIEVRAYGSPTAAPGRASETAS